MKVSASAVVLSFDAEPDGAKGPAELAGIVLGAPHGAAPPAGSHTGPTISSAVDFMLVGVGAVGESEAQQMPLT